MGTGPVDADYLRDVADLCLRMLHVVAGIAWIGASFYFIRLDLGLAPPAEPKEGVAGEYWGVHGGSCFTAEGFETACRALGVEHRKTRPYTPRTNGMAERFDGRVQREVLGITVASHRDLERLLAGFNSAYNARRQRVLGGRPPEQVVRERLARDGSLANPGHRPPPDLCVLPRAMLVVERAKDVSQPDS